MPYLIFSFKFSLEYYKSKNVIKYYVKIGIYYINYLKIFNIKK